MARKKVIRFIQAAFMVAAVVAAIPACTDDHFDVRDNAGEEGANATQTIWEQIQANPQLSKFATLVEKTPYFKDETHPISKADGTPYTFKDVLNGTQILTGEKLCELYKDRIVIENVKNGTQQELDVDAVVLALGSYSNTALCEALKNAGFENVIPVGDAVKVGRIQNATSSGYRAAVALA